MTSPFDDRNKPCRTGAWIYDPLRGWFYTAQPEKVPTLLSYRRRIDAAQYVEANIHPLPYQLTQHKGA